MGYLALATPFTSESYFNAPVILQLWSNLSSIYIAIHTTGLTGLLVEPPNRATMPYASYLNAIENVINGLATELTVVYIKTTWLPYPNTEPVVDYNTVNNWFIILDILYIALDWDGDDGGAKITFWTRYLDGGISSTVSFTKTIDSGGA